MARELDRLSHAPQVVALTVAQMNVMPLAEGDIGYSASLFLLNGMFSVRAQGFQCIWSDDWVASDPQAADTLALPEPEAVLGLLYVGEAAIALDNVH